MCAPAIAAVAAFAAANAPTIMAVTTLASGAATAYGQIRAAKQAQKAADYEGKLADVNAINAQRAAREALERGELDAVKHGREVRQLRGRQVAAQAAQGLELGFGSPLAILQDTDLLAAEDAATIAQNANREAESYRISGANYRAQAEGARARRSNIGAGTVLDVASTALNTATQLGGTWKKYGKGY